MPPSKGGGIRAGGLFQAAEDSPLPATLRKEKVGIATTGVAILHDERGWVGRLPVGEGAGLV